jgi:phosphoribosylaminoimidazolecarboxamide formyltransferase/IMP cyclohydrolase
VTESRTPVRRALVSVSDKTGLLDLATGLHAAGVQIVTTGSTAQRIAAAGVPVTRVEEVTGFPECFDGRVKTLHPRIHAGLLADLRRPEHAEQLAKFAVEPFELLVVNLYPFASTVASGAGMDECVEQIDIGGPAMVRAAAKNHANVAVAVDPDSYNWVIEQVRSGGFTQPDRQRLAAAAFRHTASYDLAVATWMGSVASPPVPAEPPGWLGASWRRGNVLRYGENPHQRAALYVSEGSVSEGGGLATAEQLHGKQMSFNNYVDADAAVRAAYDHSPPCVAIIKHANPCGVAIADDVADAYRKAHECDPVSAFGGVIAANRPVTVPMAEQVAEVFTEVILAPEYADGAVEVLSRKKNLRILLVAPPPRGGVEWRPVTGGLLVQDRDLIDAPGDDPGSWTLAGGDAVDGATLADLAFAWRAARSVKSNAIVLAAGGATVGIGMGQVNRVDAARLAVTRAGSRAAGSVGASDAFFPFPDGLQVLLDAGVRAVVQPGGSVRDEQVIAAAKAAGASLYFTGVRHFAH